MIQSAVPQLLDLAEAMRGQAWRDDLQHAIAAAYQDGWTWLETFGKVTQLLRREDSDPRELVDAVRRRVRPGSGPPADPGSDYRQAREALEHRITRPDDAPAGGDQP